MEPIVNRVAASDIEVLDLSVVLGEARIVGFDLADHMDGGLVLREKPFRRAMADLDWSAYDGAHLAVHCSTEAIVPSWAPMLVTARASAYAESVTYGSPADAVRDLMTRRLAELDWSVYADRIVVVKGCGGTGVPESAYLDATARLMEVARKVMYGEPCSSVPLWRRPRPNADS